MRFPLQNFTSAAALARFVLTTAIGLALDQWTKVIAFQKLASGVAHDPDGHIYVIPAPAYAASHGSGYALIPGWLHFTATANPGAVFGIGQGQRPLFIAVSIAAILFITWLFANSGRQRIYQVILGMLLAGVLGNMYDRIEFGYVRDMVYIFPNWRVFPWVFNVADSLLCVGVTLMIVYSVFQGPHSEGDPIIRSSIDPPGADTDTSSPRELS